MPHSACLDAGSPWSAALAAIRAHEDSLKPQRRRRHGAFYTPWSVAHALAQEALAPWLRARDVEALRRVRVIDPAAGAGMLLLAALSVLQATILGCDATLDPVALRRELCANLTGFDVDPRAGEALRRVLAIACGMPPEQCPATIHIHDALFDAPITLSVQDALIANPPFGSVNAYGKGALQARLAERFPDVWQDKMDRSALFVARAIELAPRGAILLPSSSLAADKTRRLREHLTANGQVRCLDFGDVALFADTPVRTCMVAFAPSPKTFEGWRCRAPLTPRALDAVTRAFIDGAPPPPAAAVAVTREAPKHRWFFVDSETRRRWDAMAGGETLGQRYALGKGMETGCNRAFCLSEAVVASLSEAERRFTRARLHGRDVHALQTIGPSSWLLYTPAAASFEALPAALREQLSVHREALEARAAHRRGDCEWWRFSWPLHRERHQQWRVVSPYRCAQHHFAPVPPGVAVGLTDTTWVFVDSEEEALALSVLLCSEPIVDRFEGLTKHTGLGMKEFFEYQLRDLPLPRGWDRSLQKKLANAAADLRIGRGDRKQIHAWITAAFGR